MRTVQLLAVLAALTLQGCLSVYHNTEAAYAPFPEAPANPDGVCPDLTGTYYAYACPEEPDNFTSPKRLPDKFIGKRIDQKSESAASDEQRKTAQGPQKVLPKCAPSLVLQSFVAFHYLDSERLEARSWGSTGTVSSRIYNPNSPVKVICNKGIGYWKFNTETYGLEGGSVSKSIETLSKSDEGDLIYRIHIDHSLYALRVIPGGSSREIFTYRYKAYHGSMPDN